MKTTGVLLLLALVALSQADEPAGTPSGAPTPARTVPTGAMPLPAAAAGRPRQVPVGSESAAAAAAASAAIGRSPADAAALATRFTAEAKWIMAGYNNNEIVYAITVTSQDSRILRCITDVSGFFFDQGKRMKITDRQVTTVFPSQQTPVGTWLDMDQDSGANYSVKCRPVT